MKMHFRPSVCSCFLLPAFLGVFLLSPDAAAGSEWTHRIEDHVPLDGWFPQELPPGFGTELRGVLDEASWGLGLTIGEILELFGNPEGLFPVRGAEEWQDDVVAAYQERFSFYFYQNRVWQVRLELPFPAGGGGRLSMGGDGALPGTAISPEELVRLAGPPYAVVGRSYIYLYSDRGFPVRVRFFFDDRQIHAVYLYRGDL